MAEYVVSGTHLTDIAEAIRDKGGTVAEMAFPAEFISSIKALATLGKIYQGNVNANTTSTTNVTVATLNIQMPSDFDPSKYILYIPVEDTQGKRNGRFYLSETFSMDPENVTGSGRTTGMCWRINSNGSVGGYAQSLGSGYGVYCSAVAYTAATKSYSITISARYNATYSLTINGTYEATVWAIPIDRFFT